MTQITDRKTKCKKHRVINSNFLLFCIEFTTHEQHIKKNLSFENEHNYTYIISILKFKDLKMRKKNTKKLIKKRSNTMTQKLIIQNKLLNKLQIYGFHLDDI